jgi:hypothetical protein
MKSTLICAFIAAAICSAFFVSSANAGGGHHHQGLGMSNSSMSTNVTPTGRSPLGEPVFLIPSSTVTATSGGPIGGYVAPKTPLPPLHAPPSMGATASLVSSNSGGGAPRGRIFTSQRKLSAMEKQTALSGPERGTHVIFTPPPTIVGVTPSAVGTGNIAGNSLADRTFAGSSILNTGLGSASSRPSVETLDRVSATATSSKSGPTVEVMTTSSSSKSTSSVGGH